MAATLLFDDVIFDSTKFGGEVASLLDTAVFDEVIFDTGAAVPLNQYEIDASATTFALTLPAVFVHRSRVVSANSTSYSITGQPVFNTRQVYISAVGYTGSHIGQPATLSKGASLDSSPSNNTITGQASEYLRSRVLFAEPTPFANNMLGVFNYIGKQVIASSASNILTHSQTALTYGKSLVAEPSVLNISGSGADLLKASTINLQSTSFTSTAQSVTVNATRVLTLDPKPL